MLKLQIKLANIPVACFINNRDVDKFLHNCFVRKKIKYNENEIEKYIREISNNMRLEKVM